MVVLDIKQTQRQKSLSILNDHHSQQFYPSLSELTNVAKVARQLCYTAKLRDLGKKRQLETALLQEIAIFYGGTATVTVQPR